MKCFKKAKFKYGVVFTDGFSRIKLKCDYFLHNAQQ